MDTNQGIDHSIPIGTPATIIGGDGTLMAATVTNDIVNARGYRQITIQLCQATFVGVTPEGVQAWDIQPNTNEYIFTLHFRPWRQSDSLTAQESGNPEEAHWRTLDGFPVHFGTAVEYNPDFSGRASNQEPAEATAK
jgi:hypothetical protein